MSKRTNYTDKPRQLSRQNLKAFETHGMETPILAYFDLPEKVLQFGTGVLLRGLPDYYIDKANKQNIFNGRILVVKSTDAGATDPFDLQDALYTHCLRSVENGSVVQHDIINASISRVLQAKTEWQSILDAACNPELVLVISNTTEVGIVLMDDDVNANPPHSFPGKLLAFLFRRYQHFNGDISRGLVIVPTELIMDNGAKLKSILEHMAKQNQLGESFQNWLSNANIFCNSLVDRIVPGKLTPALVSELEANAGYDDGLAIMSETYGLWAIETSDHRAKKALSFSTCDAGVIIAPDITVYRELKLRLLNGSHTFCCGLALQAGFTTVVEAMENPLFEKYITKLMLEEIVPSVISNQLNQEQASDFSKKVLDRFRNPFIQHQWASITLQYSSKMAMRNKPLIRAYIDRQGRGPALMSLGLAAWIYYMKTQTGPDGTYEVEINSKTYKLIDEHAAIMSGAWSAYSGRELVQAILGEQKIWNEDLNTLPGLTDSVTNQLASLIENGALATIKRVLNEDAKQLSHIGGSV